MTTAAGVTAPDEDLAGQPEAGRRRWAVLAVVSAAQFLTVLDLWVVNIALPALQHDFAPATLSDVSWILDVYAIVLATLLLRFLRRKDELTPAELRYFTDIDHHDHEALGALDHAGGRGVGVARYVRDTSDPQAAEIAVTVADDWQGRGLGTELLARLSGRARAEGIHRFTALVSADNAAMAGLLRSVSASPVHREHGTVEYEIPLAPAAESSSDRQRAVGGHDGRGQGGGSHQVAVDGGRCATALCERPHEQ